MISITGGQAFTSPNQEIWQRTMSLAWIELELGSNNKTLHQLWISDIGRSEWRPIVEISKYGAETGHF